MQHEKPGKRNTLSSIILQMCILMNVVASLTCHQAEYQIGQECCPMCPTGTRVNKHCTEFRSTSCLPCDEGTYMDQPTGKIECLSCRMCASVSGLKVKSSCTSTSNTMCEPLEGHYCMDTVEGNCMAVQKHTRCEPGYYISRQGSASADTVCSRCSEGTFSNGTLTQCQPHTKCEWINKETVKAGTSDSDAECAEKNSGDTTVLGISIGVVLAILILAIGLPAVIFIIRKRKNSVI